MNILTRYANPNQFYRLAQTLLPYVSVLAIVLTVTGLTWGLFFSPPDYQQGDSVRMMYVHVPAAWMSLAVYGVMGVSSLIYLVWRHTLAHIIASSSAMIGIIYTIIALASGSLWGKPMWGAWWVWDARLTSMLVLLFIYIGYVVVDGSFEQDEERGRFVSAVLALIGCVNLPIIKFSVDWWNTLHQPSSILRMDGPTIDSSMLWPLLLSIAGFKFIYLALLLLRSQNKILLYKIRRLQYANL